MVIISGGKNVYAANRPLSDGYYRIQSGNSSSRVLDINSASLNNGANLEIYQRNGGTNQIFYVQYRGYGYYSIRALHSGKYLHKDDGGNGTNVHQWENYNTSNAQWALEKSVGSYYYVRNRATGKYLDNANGSTALGNNVGLYYQNYTNAQRWKFIRVSKPAFTLKVTNKMHRQDIIGSQVHIECLGQLHPITLLRRWLWTYTIPMEEGLMLEGKVLLIRLISDISLH